MPTPSLLIVPARFKSGKLYSQLPTSGAGDFTVTRATAATRVNASGYIQSVASGIPRLDYFASGGTVGCPALLVEPSAQNLALQSENFSTTWSPVQILAFGSGSVLNTTATLDPYGTNVSDLIVANTTLNQHRVDQTITHASGSYVFSVFLKAAGYGFGRLRIGGAGATFNLSTGVVAATDATITSSIQSFGNGWYRCIIGKAASAANEIIRINMQPTQSTADFVGDGTSGIYVFGAQYETGSVATSYIPTTTAAVTRNADVVSVSGAVSGSIGQTEGTMYFEVIDIKGVSTGTGNPALAIRNTATTNWIALISNTTALPFRIIVRSTTTTLINYSSAITEGKVAIGYSASGAVVYVNGTEVASTVTNPNLTLNVVSMEQYMPFKVKSLALYTTRLTNAELAAITQL